MNSVVSIVIPTYNRAQDLERALKSVISQTYSQWEAIIVDNHSCDNTDDLIKSFNDSRLKLFKIHNNGVIAASRNLGIMHARGEYVAFLDSDDWWKAEKLEESLKYFEQGADIVYHDLYVVKRTAQRIFWKKYHTRDLKRPVFSDLLINGNALNNSSVVVRTSLLHEIGGLSEDINLIAMEDFDAWLRVAKITDKFSRVPKTLGYYWAGGGNTSNPERTIRCLTAFEERYTNDMNKTSMGTVFWRLYYSRGRAYYLLGAYALAKNILSKIQLGQAPLMVVIKACWMISICNILHNSDCYDKTA